MPIGPGRTGSACVTVLISPFHFLSTNLSFMHYEEQPHLPRTDAVRVGRTDGGMEGGMEGWRDGGREGGTEGGREGQLDLRQGEPHVDETKLAIVCPPPLHH